MIYIYPEKNLRAYPGVERGSREWEDTYKIRVNVEKSINHFKDSFCIANRKTQNEKLFMLIYFSRESHSLLPYLLRIKFININTYGV